MPQAWSGGPAALVADNVKGQQRSMLDLVRNKNNVADMALRRRLTDYRQRLTCTVLRLDQEKLDVFDFLRTLKFCRSDTLPEFAHIHKELREHPPSRLSQTLPSLGFLPPPVLVGSKLRGKHSKGKSSRKPKPSPREKPTHAFPPGKLTTRAKTTLQPDEKEQENQNRATPGRARVMVATPIMLKSRSIMTSQPVRAVDFTSARPQTEKARERIGDNVKEGHSNDDTKPHINEDTKQRQSELTLPEIPKRLSKTPGLVTQEHNRPKMSSERLPPASPAVEETNSQVMMEVVMAKSMSYGKNTPLSDRAGDFLKTVDHKNSTVLPEIVAVEN